MKKVELYPRELFDLLNQVQEGLRARVLDKKKFENERLLRKGIRRFKMRCYTETEVVPGFQDEMACYEKSDVLDLIAVSVAKLSSVYQFYKFLNEKRKLGTTEDLVAGLAFEHAKQHLRSLLKGTLGIGDFLNEEACFVDLLESPSFLDLVADQKRHSEWKLAHKDLVKQYYNNNKLEY